MAAHLTATIEYQNAYRTHVKAPEWLERVHDNSVYLEKTSNLIDDLVDYGAAKSTAELLEKQLNLPADKE